MIRLFRYDNISEFDEKKEILNDLSNNLVYINDIKLFYFTYKIENLKLFYNITDEMINNSGEIKTAIIFSRCDLLKSLKIDGIPQDLSSKEQTPYVFTSTTMNDISTELFKLMSSEKYQFQIPLEKKSFEVELEFKDNLDKNSTIALFSYLLYSGLNKISGEFNTPLNSFTFFYNVGYLKQLDLSEFYPKNILNMNSMFFGCDSITSLDLSSFDTSKVIDMQQMFMVCSGLKSLNLNNFNTSNVINMSAMFNACSGLTSLDLSNFNTSNVTSMMQMFYECSGLTSLDVSSFDTSKVSDMSNMFTNCYDLTSLDLSSFNTSKVTNMYGMFDNCMKLTSLDLSNFDTSNVSNMSSMFDYCTNLTSLDLSNFNTSKVTDMTRMFSGCNSLTHIKCKQTFKDWCITNKTKIELPNTMRDGGGGTWDIVQ